MLKEIQPGRFQLITLLFFTALFSSDLLAQTDTATAGESIGDTYYTVLAAGFIFALLLIFAGFFLFGMGEEKREKREARQAAFQKLWEKFKYAISKAKPVEEEEDILMEDDYDGIKELDNRIPPWFNYLFYATIIFGIYYLLNYQVFHTGKNQYEEYRQEVKTFQMKKAELMKSGNIVTADNVTRLTDAGALFSGKQIFKTNCVPCHGPEGGGVVGPNLTDDYWIHGGGIKNIFTTIKNGVPSKGMISWESKLTPKEIQEVASYVMSLHGTKPANAKPPQGEKWKEDKGS